MTTNPEQHPKLPSTFRAAVFAAKDAKLSLVEVDFRQPAEGELAIKVGAVALSNNELINSLGLVDGGKWPRTPGGAVLGTVVAVGGTETEHHHHGGGKVGVLLARLKLGGGHGKEGIEQGGFKLGDKVISWCSHQALAEYSTISPLNTLHVRDSFEPLDQVVVATAGARIVKAFRKFTEMQKERSEEEKRAVLKMNERMGMKGEGVVVVYGTGGLARMALTAISLYSPEKISGNRVVLVTPSDHFSHEDYRLPRKEDMLVVGKDNVDQELLKMGGAKLVIAADQPSAGFKELVDSMRIGSSLVLMTMNRETLDLPIASLITRSISLLPPPILVSSDMARALDFLEQHDVKKHLQIWEADFDVEGVNRAWEMVRRRDTMLAPVCVFGYKGGAEVGMGKAA
ncbi:hypothetical protein JCM8547_005816 [Rhodosporidiobolus lusitaniae]